MEPISIEDAVKENENVTENLMLSNDYEIPPVVESHAENDENTINQSALSSPIDSCPLDDLDNNKKAYRSESAEESFAAAPRDFDNEIIARPNTKLFKSDLLRRITQKRRARTRLSSKLSNNDQREDGVFRNEVNCVDDDEEPGIALTSAIRGDASATDDGDSITTGTWSIEDEQSGNFHAGRYNSRQRRRKPDLGVRMSAADIAICQQLDAEYDRALEERDVTLTARYQSVRQSACLSIVFMALFILLGTLFFERQAPDWGIEESLLFTIYTITTVGYGHLETPDTPAFQLYTIFFIFIGVAILTTLVAQVYQCIAIEASRAAISTDSRSSMRIWLATQVDKARHKQQNHLSQSQSETGSNYYHLESQFNATALQNPGFDLNSIEFWPHLIERLLFYWDNILTFFRENEVGRSLAVLLPFVGLIAIGAVVIGPLEGWTVMESIYFSVVSLTTVGFGDYYPTRPASIWFCIIWLPFSIGFMSLYLGNVAAFYLRLSDKNIERIERSLRREIQNRKEKAEKERLLVLERAMRGQDKKKLTREAKKLAHEATTVHSGLSKKFDRHGLSNLKSDATHDLSFSVINRLEDNTDILSSVVSEKPLRSRKGFGTIPMTDDSFHGSESVDGLAVGSHHPTRTQDVGTFPYAQHRRNQITLNSRQFSIKDQHDKSANNEGTGTHQPSGVLNVSNMATMKDVLRAIHHSNGFTSFSRVSSFEEESQSPWWFHKGPESEFLSVRSSSTMKDSRSGSVLKPSFALRALVQERLAEIVAIDIAGYQTNIEIKEYTMSITIKTLKQTADKWLIPRRARRAFRAVAFEALYFVGERNLIVHGADALFSLTPFEFHQIFSPLLAAFGDAETMEEWLVHTEVLADVDLRGTSIVDMDRLEPSSSDGRS